MTAATKERRAPRRFAPAWPSWKRTTFLTCLLIVGAAAATAHGQPLRPWHLVVGLLVAFGFLGSWRGQLISTSVRYWIPMALRNRGGHSGGKDEEGGQQAATPLDDHSRGAEADPVAHIVIQLRRPPHRVLTPENADDQLPWQTVLSWLNRYGIQADCLNITAVTRIPPQSGLRRDVAAAVTARTPQNRDTWLTYTLRAGSNVDALRARRVGIADLAVVTSRRLVAELREQGWLATVCDHPDRLARFVPPGAAIRRECWTATEYPDGFRAVYAVADPERLDGLLPSLPAARTTWVSTMVRCRAGQPATVEAHVGLLTAARPVHNPAPGLRGFHGRHHELAPLICATGSSLPAGVLRSSPIDPRSFSLPWHASATGVPIGTDRQGRAHYLGLASPEPVRITVTGSAEFGVGIVARLALSGLPIAVYAGGDRWKQLANHAGPQQVLIAPADPTPGAIVVTDDSGSAPPIPAGGISVLLRRPQQAAAPATTIVITQSTQAGLFDITTAHGRLRLSTRL